jgi:hypothetical protein
MPLRFGPASNRCPASYSVAQIPTHTRQYTFGSNGSDRAGRAAAPQKGVFCKEGEYWTVAVGENALRLKDSKGLAYMAYLLRHPGAEFHVLDLVGGVASRTDEQEPEKLDLNQESLEKTGIHIGRLGDAGELIDERAKSAYRCRLFELRGELEEAMALGRGEQAAQLREEIDALTRELSHAVGLRGRHRRAASTSERARQSITKAIRAVTDRMSRSDAALGEVFSRCIKTGTFCSYQPDPGLLISWEFGAIAIEPPVQPGCGTRAAIWGLDSIQELPTVASGLLSTAQRTPFVGRAKECGVITQT